MDKIFKKDTQPVQAKNYVIKRHINVLKKLAK